jgi:hypothetical protein
VQRRAHLVDLLRGLWTQLSALAATADAGRSTGTLGTRVRELCTEIVEQAEALSRSPPGGSFGGSAT